jgi:hypothetical protein
MEQNIIKKNELYLKNLDSHLDYLARKCTCVLCGRVVNKVNLVKHMKTKLCQKIQDIIKQQLDDDSDYDSDY